MNRRKVEYEQEHEQKKAKARNTIALRGRKSGFHKTGKKDQGRKAWKKELDNKLEI